MMRTARTVVKHCATGIDGETYDVMRIGLMLGIIALIVFTGYHLLVNKQFDPSGLGISLGSLLGGSGAGIGLKAKTEPPARVADDPDAK